MSLLKRRVPQDRVVFAESIRFGNELRSAQQGLFKLIHYFQGDARRFYDLTQDPGEKRPLRLDPSGGQLFRELVDYAAVADRGWHLKLLAVTRESLRCRGTLRTEGRILAPRRYFSGNLRGPSQIEFRTFELSDDGHQFSFDCELASLIGEITFTTEPPDAPLTFAVEVHSENQDAGVFLGSGEPLTAGIPTKLVGADPRLHGLPQNYGRTPAGCYIRYVQPPAGRGETTDLSPAAVERLKSLGY
jgi:hypothetical protein